MSVLVKPQVLSLFCPKGKMLFKPKKNLRIGEAELSLFLTDDVAKLFPAPMEESYALISEAGGPAAIETGQTHETQRIEFRATPDSAPSLLVECGALTVDRLEKFERVKVPRIRLTLQARFTLDDTSCVWLKNALGTTIFMHIEDAQLELPGVIDRKSAAAGEREEVYEIEEEWVNEKGEHIEDPRQKMLPHVKDPRVDATQRLMDRPAATLAEVEAAGNEPLPAAPRTKRVGKKGKKG